MDNKIKMINENGEEVIAEVILEFELEGSSKKYVTYTLGEENGTNQIFYTSVIEENEDKITLKKLTDDEWIKAKDLYRKMIKGENIEEGVI